MRRRPRFLGPGGKVGTFTVDAESTAPLGERGSRLLTAGTTAWEAYPLPEFSASTVDGFQATMRSVTLQDTAVNELWGSSLGAPLRSGTMSTTRSGCMPGCAVALQDPHDQGGDACVSAGTYFMHHVVTDNHFHTTPEIGTCIFIFPGDALRSLVAGRPRAGQATLPAAQILMHGTHQHGAADRERPQPGGRARVPQRAARTDQGTGPRPLRRPRAHLHPGAGPGGQGPGRRPADRRRLVAARDRRAPARLGAHPAAGLRECGRVVERLHPPPAPGGSDRGAHRPGPRLNVSEAAARWHFTDSSHFIRAFKKQYQATTAHFVHRPA